VGTDEHGLKIQQAAAAVHKDPQLLCDENSEKFKRLFNAADIQYSSFIRTTDKAHITGVEHAWKILRDKNLIVNGNLSID
jgi:methionyl-tRNA synthetase